MATAMPTGRVVTLGVATVLFVPLAVYYLFIFAWVFPSYSGYPVCDPEFQPWCEHDPMVTVRWILGATSGAAALVSLILAYVWSGRSRAWWAWLVAVPVLLVIGSLLFGSLFGV